MTGTVVAKLRPFVTEYRAYAQVEPRTVLPINATATGVIAVLRVSPGQHVKAGETVANLTGSEYTTEQTAARARFRAARTVWRTAQHNYPNFSSAKDVANAQAALQGARAALRRIEAAGELHAPVAGTVLSLNVSRGERVSPGTPVLQLLPDHDLWLRATLYDQEVRHVHPGMTGRFYPEHDGTVIPIRVTAVIPPLTAGGGLRIACVAITAATWQDGEAGTVAIASGPATQLPVIPTAALILDQGKWWVLIADAHGLHRQPVEIGPSAGEWTFIRRGLESSERVVAVNAYLLFHAEISRHYAPPD